MYFRNMSHLGLCQTKYSVIHANVVWDNVLRVNVVWDYVVRYAVSLSKKGFKKQNKKCNN